MSQGCVAAGNILPSSIVIIDTALGANQVLQATSATAGPLYGVAQAGTHNTPLAGLDDGFAAVAGDNVTVFTASDLCQVVIGAAVLAGQLLTTNGSGQAIPANATDYVVGQAIDAGTTAGQFIQMRVMPYKI